MRDAVAAAQELVDLAEQFEHGLPAQLAARPRHQVIDRPPRREPWLTVEVDEHVTRVEIVGNQISAGLALGELTARNHQPLHPNIRRRGRHNPQRKHPR